MVVSQNRGTLIYTPTYDSPYNEEPQNDTPNFGETPHIHISILMQWALGVQGQSHRIPHAQAHKARMQDKGVSQN